MFVSEKAPAKINLTLDALCKRADGYHELESIMTTVDLADRIDLFLRHDQKITLESSSGLVPHDEKNLAYRAALLLQEKTGIRKGVHIRIYKKIPVAAGLAGGSSDAAATLRGCNRLWGLGLSERELIQLGAKIGSDVPFCVHSGTALAKGRGEILSTLPPPPLCWVVLAKPPISVPTVDIFQRLKVDQIKEHPNTEKMIQAIYDGDYVAITQNMANILESVTFELFPEVQKIKDKDSTVWSGWSINVGEWSNGFFFVKTESRAKRLVNSLKGFCSQVFAVRMLGT